MLVANEIACLVVFVQVADGVAVFHDILTLAEVAQQELVAGGDVIFQHDSPAAGMDSGSAAEWLDSHCHIVSYVDSQIISHNVMGVDSFDCKFRQNLRQKCFFADKIVQNLQFLRFTTFFLLSLRTFATDG